MAGADEGPFACHVVDGSHQELAEPSGLLDLAEHRLDGLHSEAVAAAPPGALEALAHGLDPGAASAASAASSQPAISAANSRIGATKFR